MTGERAVSPERRAAVFEAGLRRTLARLVAAGTEVVLIDVAPKPWAVGVEFDTQQCAPLLLFLHPSGCTMPSFAPSQGYTPAADGLEEDVARPLGVATWNFGEDLCPHGRCRVVRDRPPYWTEPLHITPAASDALVPAATRLLEQQLA